MAERLQQYGFPRLSTAAGKDAKGGRYTVSKCLGNDCRKTKTNTHRADPVETLVTKV